MNLIKTRENRLHRLSLLAIICVLLMSPGALFAQAGAIVKGTVTDDKGPLVGVAVTVQGTKTVAMTDMDGKYTITAPDNNATLVFSYLGYTTFTEQVGQRGIVDVVMTEDATALGEVVVIGYGTQRKEAVTGSVASIGGTKLAEIPSGNITQALQARIAGVEMTQSSSRPGAEMQIRIRGSRSLTATNDPLVVLDGIPFAGTLGDINPNDIKSIDILKDASATAIYGSRGANGVILVTTLKGVQGQKATVSYNGYYGVKNALRVPMMTGDQVAALKMYLATNAPPGTTGLYTSAGPDEALGVNTDWQDLMLKSGMVTSHDINVSGGSASGIYSIGGGFYRDEAVIATQNYTRYSLRATVEQSIGKYFRFGLTTNNNYNVSNGNQLGMEPVLSRNPMLDIYNADGSLKERVSSSGDNNNWVYIRETIEANKDKWLDQTRAFGSYNMLFGEVKAPWIDGLKYRINVGLNFNTRTQGAFRGQGVNQTNPSEPSSASVDNRWTTNWAIENLLTFDRTFAEKHNINVTALYSAEQTTYNRSNMSARDIPYAAFQFYNIGRAEGTITVDPRNQDYQQNGLLSWMGRVMYSFDDRYMLSATIRSDGSSRLAPGYLWHTYPAVSAGWNIHKESFMENISVVNALKLRVGFGQTSNQAVAPYKTLGALDSRPYNFGNTFYTGYYVAELPNTKLGWEFSTTWNFGLDFTLLNNRLWGTIEYYMQTTDNVLQSVKLPPTSGVNSYMANIGKTENKGFELTLNGVILNNLNGWTWEAGLNFYLNRNKLTELASGALKDEANWWFVGYPIDCIFDYEAIGLWQDGDPYMTVYEPGVRPGSIRVKYTGDYNADGSPVRGINTSDRQVMSTEANFQGGFNTRVAYKGFDLNIVGAFKNGGILISTLYQGNGYLNMLSGRRGQVDVDFWRPDNTGAKWPNPYGLRSGDNPKYLNSLGYFDASYLKIRTITLGYNFESNWVKSIGIERLRVYATVQNPFVMFSPYHDQSGLDPEPNARGNDGSFTAANSSSVPSRYLVVGTNTPNTRNWLFGINFTF